MREGVDLIYVDKCGDVADNSPDTWKYFRFSPVTGLGVPAGEEGSTIQICLLKWPNLEDVPPVSDIPGNVGQRLAFENVKKVLAQWGIDRDRSVLIGLRDTHARY